MDSRELVETALRVLKAYRDRPDSCAFEPTSHRCKRRGINSIIKRDKRIDAALEISLQGHQPISVNELAAVAGLSPSRFSHLFVQRTGILPGAYLRLMKKLRKEQLLASEILGELACSILKHSKGSRGFCRVYKKDPSPPLCFACQSRPLLNKRAHGRST